MEGKEWLKPCEHDYELIDVVPNFNDASRGFIFYCRRCIDMQKRKVRNQKCQEKTRNPLVS